MNSAPRPGSLYVVASPIGNLEDISLRAVRILGEVDIIACEDTRHSRKLLNHLGIKARLVSYYRERERQRSSQLLDELRQGRSVALISDAGTPGISDPGAVLVREAREENIRIEAVAGPSAMAAALSVGGLDDDAFLFLGFLPAKRGERKRRLESTLVLHWPILIYVAPHSLSQILGDCLDILGDRDCIFCRELTKIHEESTAVSLLRLKERIRENRVKGEIVLLIKAASRQEGASTEDSLVLLKNLFAEGLSLRDAVRRVRDETGLSRKQVYQQALGIWEAKE